MKKILFGTTALLAGAFAASANAAEPIKLSVGGQMIQWFGFVSQEDEKTGATQFQPNMFSNASDTEVHFKGNTTLDNGTKVSAVIELEAERTAATTRNADQQYLVLSGGWGELSMGERFHVAHRIHNSAPQFGISFQDARSFVEEPNAANGFTAFTDPLNNEYGTSVNMAEGRGTVKIDYVSPSFAGFAVGFGYTPNPSATGRNLDNEATTAHDSVAVGLAYAGTFSGVAIGADAGLYRQEFADNGTVGGSVQGFQSGLKAGMAGFTVGGSYLNLWNSNNNVATSAVQGTAWDAGASYETGPYGVSVTYYELSQEATRAVPANDDLKAWSVAGKYTAGPGVVFDLSGVHMDYKNEDKTDRNSTKGLAVIGGVRLAF